MYSVKSKIHQYFQEKSIPTDTVVVTTPSINVHRPRENVTYEEHEKLLWLRKTEQPDIYDLYEQENSLQKMGIASVPFSSTK